MHTVSKKFPHCNYVGITNVSQAPENKVRRELQQGKWAMLIGRVRTINDAARCTGRMARPAIIGIYLKSLKFLFLFVQ